MEINNLEKNEKRNIEDDLTILPPEEVEGVLCEELKDDDFEEILKLAERMIVKCVSSGGVGLSGPQVGIRKRIFVWMFKEGLYQVAINPKFYPNDKKKINMIEGCLTYPGKKFYIKDRFKSIRAVYYTINKDEKKLMKITKVFTGLPAIIYQHENDHLQGITISTKGTLIEDKTKNDKDMQ